MFIFRRKRIEKELNLQKKVIIKKLKSYEKALKRLREERGRLSSLSSLSESDLCLQYEFIDSRINDIESEINSCKKSLDDFERYEGEIL